MIDLLLLLGSALCVISIVLAVIAVAQTRAPRGAAIALMLGIIALLVGAKMNPAAMTPENMVGAWQRLFAGEVSLSAPAILPDPEADRLLPPPSDSQTPAAATQ